MASKFKLQLYQIYADKIKIVLPSDEPIDVRTKKLLNNAEPPQKNEDVDSDDDILTCFNNVAQAVNPNTSAASSVRVGSITF